MLQVGVPDSNWQRMGQLPKRSLSKCFTSLIKNVALMCLICPARARPRSLHHPLIDGPEDRRAVFQQYFNSDRISKSPVTGVVGLPESKVSIARFSAYIP